MEGFIIKINNNEAKEVILKDMNEANIQERVTMKTIFKRKIISEDDKLIINYSFRKAFKKKFNNNINLDISSHSVMDIPREIEAHYQQIGLIKDIDFCVEVY